MGNCVGVTYSTSEDLRKCDRDHTPKWTLAGRTQPAKIVNVVDGDTVDLAIELLPNQFYQFRVRLYGIDTPEKRPPKASPNRDAEIAASKRSTEALTNYLKPYDNMVHTVVFKEADKYGRWLCNMYCNGQKQSINDWMIQEGFAKPYFGGTKEKFEDQKD